MFFTAFDNLPKRKQAVLKELPPIPENGWRPPQYFPNLSNAVTIGIDCETKETDFDHGPGWARDKGHIVGFSVAAMARDGSRGKWYFPVRHETESEWNLDPVSCFGWLRETLASPTPKTGANLIYDMGWLTTENIDVKGELLDVQFAEALIDEEGKTALDFLGRKYGAGGKDTADLYGWLAQAFGGNPTGAQRANIWRAPPRLVGPYAEADADLPLTILARQWPVLEAQGLVDLFRMECASIPLLVRMRLAGVSVDLNRAHELDQELETDGDALEVRLFDMTGIRCNVNSPDDVARVFDAAGLKYPRTAGGAPSFVKEFLQAVEHPVGKLINSIRELRKIRSTFVQSYLLESHKPSGDPGRGTVHCVFHPLRSDDGGAKTGRFASSDPNLQNIPVRSEAGRKVRSAFITEPGHKFWKKIDYSQIEYRMLAHFATGVTQEEMAACERLRETYVNNPKTDYHDNTYAMVCPLMGWDFNDPDKVLRANRRKPIKNINFGLVYGQTEKALAIKAGWTPAQAKEFFGAYHKAAPYAKSTMKAIANEVQQFGYVTTIAGRRTRFELYEPTFERNIALPLEQALQRYGSRIKRAYDYKGVNYKLQGSAADVIKRAMVRAFQDGVFDVTGYPKLQVHDELDFSVIDDSPQQREAYEYLIHVLENTTACRVPVAVDVKNGPNWGAID